MKASVQLEPVLRQQGGLCQGEGENGDGDAPDLEAEPVIIGQQTPRCFIGDEQAEEEQRPVASEQAPATIREAGHGLAHHQLQRGPAGDEPAK